MDTQFDNRYFLELSFAGNNYHGWQIQPNAISIQELVGSALSTLLRHDPSLTGSGRTDTGVHAHNYTAHFDSYLTAEELSAKEMKYKLNRILPKDIAIKDIREVRKDAHARFSALSRSYTYIICRAKDPFMTERAWLNERPMSFEALQEATEILFKYNDFKAFSRSNTQVKHYRCRIMEAEWTREGHLWHFHIKADRFLRNMVRAIVGTLAEVGLGKISPDDFRAIIESKNRSNAGYSVPGCGLYFMGAQYNDDIYIIR